MNVTSLFHHFVRSDSNDWQASAARREAEQPIRLPPTVEASELPPEFEDVLEVQVLGYRERVTTFHADTSCTCSIRSGRSSPRTGNAVHASIAPGSAPPCLSLELEK